MKTANAPLFKDPIHNGAADPVVIYNEETGTHYMLYTARRADVEEEGVMWVHGTDIGIAESKDNGNSRNIAYIHMIKLAETYNLRCPICIFAFAVFKAFAYTYIFP